MKEANKSFQNVKNVKYLGWLQTNQNCMREEIIPLTQGIKSLRATLPA
jgi:hypothetical protein